MHGNGEAEVFIHCFVKRKSRPEVAPRPERLATTASWRRLICASYQHDANGLLEISDAVSDSQIRHSGFVLQLCLLHAQVCVQVTIDGWRRARELKEASDWR